LPNKGKYDKLILAEEITKLQTLTIITKMITTIALKGG
jgi:hypothetical protein